MHLWQTKFLVAIILITYGCAPIPPHEQAQVMDSCGCDEAASSALLTGDFTQGEGPSRTWWKEFQDPALTELIEKALILSPTLQRAEASLKAATEVALQKKAVLFPEMDFQADNNWQHLSKDGFYRAFAPSIPAVVNDMTMGLSFSYEFDFWGKNRDLFHAALGRAAALAAERIQAELIVTTSIAYTYTELQFLLVSKEIIEKRKENEKAIEDFRTKRMSNALDTAISQLGAESNTLQVEITLTELELEILKLIHKIKALAGLSQDTPLTITTKPFTPLQLSLPKNLSLDLISRRPDLIAQKARIEAASKEIGAAKTDFYPNINLTSLIGLESVNAASLFRKSNYSAFIDPALHLPIFTAGRLKAHLKEKVANFNEAVYAYNELILQTAQEVADRLTDISLLEKEISVGRTSLQVTKKQAFFIERRVKHALDNQIDWKLIQNTVLEKEIQLAGLEYAKQLEGILLIRALGGGYYD